MAAPTITLNNGQKMPILGLGTYQGNDEPNTVKQVIEDAIDAGYRLFDCAHIYGNEKDIGEALNEEIAKGVVKREDLFVVTKLWNNAHRKDLVVPACKKSLEDFGFDYIDLYLIHWPFAYEENAKGLWPVDEQGNSLTTDVDYLETWQEMEECVRLGLTKSIGLSNFNSEQIDRVLSIAKIKPVINQVECHPNLNQKKLREFCATRNIVIMAYSPFGSALRPWASPDRPDAVINHDKIEEIGKKYKKTTAQIVLRYLVDIGTVPIPKSSSKERIRLNIDVFDFKLTPEEIADIDKVNSGMRVFPVLEFKDHKYYPFHLEF